MHEGRAEHVFQHCRSLCRLASDCTVYRASARRQRCAKRQHSTSTRRRNVSRRTRATTQTVRPMQKKPRRNRRQIKSADRNRMCRQAQEQLILSESEDHTTCFSIKNAKTKCACMSFGGSYSAKMFASENSRRGPMRPQTHLGRAFHRTPPFVHLQRFCDLQFNSVTSVATCG